MRKRGKIVAKWIHGSFYKIEILEKAVIVGAF
jgi:hypothetical protein